MATTGACIRCHCITERFNEELGWLCEACYPTVVEAVRGWYEQPMGKPATRNRPPDYVPADRRAIPPYVPPTTADLTTIRKGGSRSVFD